MRDRLTPVFRSLLLFASRTATGTLLGAIGGFLLVAAVRNLGVQGGAVVSNNYTVGAIIGGVNGTALGIGYAILAAFTRDWRKPAAR